MTTHYSNGVFPTALPVQKTPIKTQSELLEWYYHRAEASFTHLTMREAQLSIPGAEADVIRVVLEFCWEKRMKVIYNARKKQFCFDRFVPFTAEI